MNRSTSRILVILFFLCPFMAPCIEGYYRDLFMDGGVDLTSRTTLPAADFLGLSWEFLATSDQTLQDEIIIGTPEDPNGVLLYPDGSPRFRCVYVNGGSATNHGKSLGETGRQRFRDFFFNGGSYTGSCAGAFIVTRGYNDYTNPYYLHIWPARARTTGLYNGYTGHFIPGGSSLLNYCDFGGDLYIANVRHNGGSYYIEGSADHWTAGTESLLLYDYPERAMHRNVSCLSYDHDELAGRVVVVGSHPEGVTSGERRDLMAAILELALEGTGLPSLKSYLENGKPRVMNDNATPGFEKIGDGQYHHFAVDILTTGTNLTISLDGDDGFNLDLFAKKGDYAFLDQPGVIKAENTSSADETITIDHPLPGIWFISVKCVTKVLAEKADWGWIYTDKLAILDGVEYEIRADWEILSPKGNYWILK